MFSYIIVVYFIGGQNWEKIIDQLKYKASILFSKIFLLNKTLYTVYI